MIFIDPYSQIYVYCEHCGEQEFIEIKDLPRTYCDKFITIPTHCIKCLNKCVCEIDNKKIK